MVYPIELIEDIKKIVGNKRIAISYLKMELRFNGWKNVSRLEAENFEEMGFEVEEEFKDTGHARILLRTYILA